MTNTSNYTIAADFDTIAHRNEERALYNFEMRQDQIVRVVCDVPHDQDCPQCSDEATYCASCVASQDDWDAQQAIEELAEQAEIDALTISRKVAVLFWRGAWRKASRCPAVSTATVCPF